MKKILLIIILFLSCTANADIYTWQDTQGGTHIADAPEAGATHMKLPPATVYRSDTQPIVTVSIADAATPQASMLDVYASFSIIQPLNQQIFVNDESGNLAVKVAIDPALQGSDSVRLFVDGKLYPAQKSLTFSLSNIDRGTHVLQAQIIDEHGDVLCTSTSVTIYMQRQRIKF